MKQNEKREGKREKGKKQDNEEFESWLHGMEEKHPYNDDDCDGNDDGNGARVMMIVAEWLKGEKEDATFPSFSSLACQHYSE